MLLDRATVKLTEVCAKHPKVPGEQATFIRTRAGTYQFVGSIRAEKTTGKVPILCQPNLNENAEEEFVCSGGLICKDNQFCYKTEKDQTPALGHFYKITWGVTAPQDESFTPYVDENGVAIKFNLQFKGMDFWLYQDERGRGSKQTIQLKNGEKDGGVIIQYSLQDFNEVCILFAAAPKDWSGNEVSKICTGIVPTTSREADQTARTESASTTTQSGEVVANTNW